MVKERFSRQSFLGEKSQETIESAVIGVVGLGGGGSHIVQQLAHIGFLNYVLYDHDIAEESNLNRLVGIIENDVVEQRSKIEIAYRVISGLRSKSSIERYAVRWQENPEPLRKCDIIFGCLDGFAERRELEACTRRYLIPYIDIGMDVHCIGDAPPRMAGQIVLSMPGELCLQCLGFLNEKTLAQEAAKYGDVGIHPQVIWANGILASTAVSIAVDLLTDWTKDLRDVVYLEYDGNNRTIRTHPRLEYREVETCQHYPLSQIGDPVFNSV